MVEANFYVYFEVTQVNSFKLYCLTREEGTKLVPLLELKKMLVKELILEAEKIIPPGHKLYVIRKPNDSVFKTTQPTHIVVWIDSDRNCAVCSTPGDRKRTKHLYLHTKNCFEQFHKNI